MYFWHGVCNYNYSEGRFQTKNTFTGAEGFEEGNVFFPLQQLFRKTN